MKLRRMTREFITQPIPRTVKSLVESITHSGRMRLAILLGCGLCTLPAAALRLADCLPLPAATAASQKATQAIDPFDKNAENAIADLRQAEAAIDKKDYPTAEALLQKVLDKNAGNYRAWFDLGYIENELGHRKEAIEDYRRSVAAEPGIFESNLNLGILLAEEDTFSPQQVNSGLPPQQAKNGPVGDPGSEAAKYLRAATELKPSIADPKLQRQALARAWLSLARVLRNGDREGAAAAYRRACELAPADAIPHLEMGTLLEQAKQDSEAEKELKVAAELAPQDRDVLAALANFYMRAGRTAEAEQTLRRFLALDANDATAHLQLGRLLKAQNKTDEASVELQKALVLAPGDRDVRFELAELQAVDKHYDEAAQSYRALLAETPRDAQLHYALGLVLLRQLDYAEAEQELASTVRLKPDWGEAYGDLAVAASGNKHYPLALRALDARVGMLPETAGTYFLRATCLDNLGEYKEAARNYRLFLAADKGSLPDQEWQARHRLIAIDPESKRR